MKDMLKLLPVRFLALALVYLLAGLLLGLMDALGMGGFNSSHSHLMAGGFFGLVIMGAMYQLLPTILGGELKYRRVAELHFLLVNLAFIAIAYSFLANYSFLKVAGLIAVISFLLFALVIVATAASVREFYRRSIAIWYFMAALLYLLVGSTYALGGILGLTSFNIALHSHLMTLGFVAMVNFGGLYELFPMLSLRKLHSRNLGKVHFAVANLGAIGMFIGFPSQGSLFLVSSAIFLLGFYLFAYNMARTYFGEAQGPALETDISARFMAYAFIFGVIGVTAGFSSALTGFPPTFTHVHFILGWVALTIVGAMYHIVPMLTWMEKYAPRAAEGKAPLISDLYSKKLSRVLFPALIALLAAFALSPSALSALALKFLALPLALAFAAFAVEMVLVLRR